LEQQIGSIEIGKKADLAIIGLDNVHTSPKPADLISSIVYSAGTADLQTVIVDGRVLMKNRKLLTLDERGVIADANKQTSDLLERAGLR